MSDVIVKAALPVRLPQVPNFVRLGDSGQAVDVAVVTDKVLRDIGKAWTAALLANAAKRRKAPPMTAPPEPGGTYPLYWRVRKVRPEWFGRRCRIVARGRRMDSRMIEFDNGERVITLGSYLRKWRLTPPDPREGNR